MNICSYGCGQEATNQFKNGKFCCSVHYMKCKSVRYNNSGVNNSFFGKNHSLEAIEKNREFNIGRKQNKKTIEKKKKISIELWKKEGFRKKVLKNLNRRTIKMIENKYPFFSQIEEMRYNPDKVDEKEIQIHCKNHNCKNSKEQGGWFTPSGRQLELRIWSLEHKDGNEGSYFYCSDECKNICPLYNLQTSKFMKNDLNYYDSGDYQTFRTFVLERDKNICQYCGEQATDVHHERSQKLEPFFALDPDFAWSCCEKCHYKYGHKDECSTGKIASISCL